MAHLRRGGDGGTSGGVGMYASVWVEEATRKIRFGPDRKAVGRELAAHIEDLREKYEAQGLSPYDAEMKATAEMGDPADIAEDLGRLHRPYLGWLWRLSQWALGITAVIAAFLVIPYLFSLPSNFPTYHPQLPEAVETWEYGDGTTRTVTMLQSWEPEGKVKLGSYNFTIPMAWLTRSSTRTAADGTVYPERYELAVVLRAVTWRFWEPISTDQYMILSSGAADSGGNRYGLWETGLFGQEANRNYFCNSRSSGLSTVYYEMFLDLPSAEAPDWVDIPVGYGGDVLRLNLAEGTVTEP